MIDLNSKRIPSVNFQIDFLSSANKQKNKFAIKHKKSSLLLAKLITRTQNSVICNSTLIDILAAFRRSNKNITVMILKRDLVK